MCLIAAYRGIKKCHLKVLQKLQMRIILAPSRAVGRPICGELEAVSNNSVKKE